MAVRSRSLALVAALFAAACATVPHEPPTAPETPKQASERRSQAAKPAYNLTGYPPAVRDGYIDGCESAKGTSYARKDVSRMSDPQYSMGWNDGYSICKSK
jgi:hypothetical protein